MTIVVTVIASWMPRLAAADECTFYVRAGFVPSQGVADGRTPTSAFATITAAANAMRNPGDVVCVGPGLYVEGNIGPRVSGAGGPPDEEPPGGASSGLGQVTVHPVEFRADPTGRLTGDRPEPVRLVPPEGDASIATGFLVLGRQHVVIDGFTISGFKDAGIQVRASIEANSANVTIRNNTISYCGTGIDVLAQDLIVIEHNRTIGNRTSGISVDRCLVSSDSGRCRTVADAPSLPVISNNRSGGNDAHGIFVRAADHAVVQNNVVYSNRLTGISLRGSADTLVANNLSYANAESGLAIGRGADPSIPSPGTIVLNNTFYGNGTWGIEAGSPQGPSPRLAVVNNIVWGNAKGIGVLNENSGQNPVRPATVCGYVAGYNFVPLDGYGPSTPFNAFDRHEDPGLVNPAGADGMLGGERIAGVFLDNSADDDFHLRQVDGEGPRSPAIDAGSDAASLLGLTGSTANDVRPDAGIVDAGFHYGAVAEQVLGYVSPFMPLYVRGGGSDQADGRTPARALATVSAAADGARAGVSVIVGPGRYQDCRIAPPANSGRAAFVADPQGRLTGDLPGNVVLDATRCIFNPSTGTFDEQGDVVIQVVNVCDALIDGFHVRGASDQGIRIDAYSDGTVVRNNVISDIFTMRDPGRAGGRGIQVRNSQKVRIANNLLFNNNAGILLGGVCRTTAECDDAGARDAVIEFNTVYRSKFNGIQVGDGIGVSSGATVRYNVTGESQKNGVEVGSNTTRAANLVGYRSSYNLVTDSYAPGLPRGVGDLLIDSEAEPLYLEPTAIDLDRLWTSDHHFRLVQRAAGQGAQSRAVDYADVSAVKAGLSDRSTRSDGAPDTDAADLGYHYPRPAPMVGDCDGDGRVQVNEVVMAVGIALEQLPLGACLAADSNGDGRVAVNELVAAVGSALQG